MDGERYAKTILRAVVHRVSSGLLSPCQYRSWGQMGRPSGKTTVFPQTMSIDWMHLSSGGVKAEPVRLWLVLGGIDISFHDISGLSRPRRLGSNPWFEPTKTGTKKAGIFSGYVGARGGIDVPFSSAFVHESLASRTDGFSSQLIWIGARGGIRTSHEFNSHKATQPCVSTNFTATRGFEVTRDTQPPEGDQGNRALFSPAAAWRPLRPRLPPHPVRQDGVHQRIPTR